MASAKHEPPSIQEELETKRTRLTVEHSLKSEPKQRVELNPADCDLDFNIEGNCLQGHALHDQGFAYCWSGARANAGITGGKYCFGCKIISIQTVVMEDTPPEQQHVCRVGISRGDDAVANLGETEHSFGFGGTGKFSNSGKFSDYGGKFGVGDTIVCCIDLENKPLACIGFSKNGKWLGVAKQFDAGPKGLGVVESTMKKLQWQSALFPHVLLKNVVVEVQFSIEDGLVPEEGYKPWASALEDGNAVLGPSFSNPKDCEVMMMVGLPASGKTTWAEKWVKQHPEKRYVLLGTNLALDQMKVPGLLRKQNYGERFDRLMDRATGIFNTLLARAAKTPRNYILDQTNVYKSARKRKLKPFSSYRKIAVVIFPVPDELRLRAEKRFKEMGKEVPAEAVNEMLANYVLPRSKDMPGSDELFDEVMFPELNRVESQRNLDEMKRALGSASSLNSKNNLAPYSRESSVQSFSSSSLQNPGAVSATGGHLQSYNSPLPLQGYAYQRAQHMNSASPGAQATGLYGKPDLSRQCDLNFAAPREEPYRTYSSHCSSLPRDGSDSYGSYGGYDPIGRQNFENRTPISRGGTEPYWSCGGVDNYRRPNIESGSPIPGGSIDPHCGPDSYSTPKFMSSFGSHIGSSRNSPYRPDGHFSGPGYPPEAPRESPFLRDPSSISYGSPYGTPPRRPLYGNLPTEWGHYGGHAPPGPRYP